MRAAVFLMAALLLTAIPGFSTNFVAMFAESDHVLTTNCDGTGDPLADGTPVKIFWDANNNGPDETDAQVELCKDAPKCEEGPAGTYNFNEFTLNGSSVMGIPGTFALTRGFTSAGVTPVVSRFFLRVMGSKVTWTSNVFTVQPGPQELEISGWTCSNGGTGEAPMAPSVSAVTITEYALKDAFPNPFNPTTKITYDLVDAQNVKLSVFNLLGQEVKSLVNGRMDAGRHTVTFDANGLPSGLYMYRIEAGSFTALNKMLLLK